MAVEQETIRVVIADDFEDIRKYFSMVLGNEQDIEVVGTAVSGEEAYALVEQLEPDIVLMDVQMETKYAGIDALHKIRENYPSVSVIMLTIHVEDEVLFQAYGEGAVDFLEKDSSIVDILESIRSVYHKKVSLRPEVAQRMLDEFSRMHMEQTSLIFTLNIMAKLTQSEFEILKRIYNGATYREIANERSVEDVTIRTQANRILKKFGKRSIKEVVALLKHLRIFEIYGE